MRNPCLAPLKFQGLEFSEDAGLWSWSRLTLEVSNESLFWVLHLICSFRLHEPARDMELQTELRERRLPGPIARQVKGEGIVYIIPGGLVGCQEGRSHRRIKFCWHSLWCLWWRQGAGKRNIITGAPPRNFQNPFSPQPEVRAEPGPIA
jgi:hypothetical protein